MSEDVKRNAVAWLADVGEQTAAFRISDRVANGHFDWEIKVHTTAGGPAIPIHIETKKRITPQEFLGFRQRVEQLAPKETVILCAPSISPRVAEMCRESGIGYLDVAGNCHIAAPGLFVHIEGRQVPRQPRKASDLFAPKSSRIARVLLSDVKRGWQVQELAKEADVSLGLTSRIKQALLEEAYVESRDGRLYVSSPRALLQAWQSRYELPERRWMYVMGQPKQFEGQIADWANANGKRYALTGFSGAWRVAPMVGHNVTMLYVEPLADAQFAELTTHLGAKSVENGANLSLWLPRDDSVFYGMRTFKGRMVVSPLQLYLDLTALHGRGEEAAQEILERELEPQWPT